MQCASVLKLLFPSCKHFLTEQLLLKRNQLTFQVLLRQILLAEHLTLCQVVLLRSGFHSSVKMSLIIQNLLHVVISLLTLHRFIFTTRWPFNSPNLIRIIRLILQRSCLFLAPIHLLSPKPGKILLSHFLFLFCPYDRKFVLPNRVRERLTSVEHLLLEYCKLLISCNFTCLNLVSHSIACSNYLKCFLPKGR